MKKLVVSEDTCISCGACMQIDEEHFDFSSKGISTVISQENLDSEVLKQAIEACPVAAISIIETAEEDNNTTSENTANTETSNNEIEVDCNCGDDCNCNHEAKCGNCKCHNEECEDI